MPAKGLSNPNAGTGSRFEKGQSGNPTGYSKDRREANKALAEVLRGHVSEATETLLDLMKNSKVDSVRLRVSEIIYDRVYGKAVQRLGGENEGDQINVYIQDFMAPIVRTDDEPTPAG
jgi:hypothetical protein